MAVVGLGSMGGGMARALRMAGHDVVGIDPSEAARAAFEADGGTCIAPGELSSRSIDVLVIAVVTAAQTRSVLTGADGLADALADGAVILSCSTMPPDETRALADTIEAGDARDIAFLDCPMSGGPAKAASGTLTFMASGSAAAFKRAQSALEAMGEKTYRLGDAPGAGSSMKLVNQLLAGVHIAAACEAMTLAVRMGLEPRQVYEVITNAAGNSWMFENRMPHVLEGDYSPKSAVNIFTKDLGIVSDTGRAQEFPTPMAGQALQLFTMAAAAGMGGDDDTSVARVYAMLAGLELPARES
ncbi:MAG: L-threonate dehydrogenase [Pseudomonadota bacterium]